MIDFAAARRMMVDGQVRTSDVTDLRIIAAMLELPRERFVPASNADPRLSRSRRSRHPPTGGERRAACSSPWSWPSWSRRRRSGRGTGCSMSAARPATRRSLLARLARSVVALEQDPALVRLRPRESPGGRRGQRDGRGRPFDHGWQAEAPYDVIFVNGATEIVPHALCRQLKDGGRLVAVMGRPPNSRAMVYRSVAGDVSGWPIFDASAPLLPGFAAPRPSSSRSGVLSIFPQLWCGAKTPRGGFLPNRHFRQGSAGLAAPLWLTLAVSGRVRLGPRPEVRDGGRGGCVHVAGGSGAAGDCAGAQIAAFAASAMAALPGIAPAAEVAANGRVGVGAGSGTMDGALVQAYRNNPQLNAQRAQPARPTRTFPPRWPAIGRASRHASLAEQYLDTLTKRASGPRPARLHVRSTAPPPHRSVGLTATQTLFNGFQTGNRTRQAEGRCPPPARPCARPSRTRCSMPPPPT